MAVLSLAVLPSTAVFFYCKYRVAKSVVPPNTTVVGAGITTYHCCCVLTDEVIISRVIDAEVAVSW